MNDTIGREKCWFCGKRPAQSGALVQIKMSKVAGRSALGSSRRVDYYTKKVLMPRCSSCKSIHDKAKFLKWGAICLMIAAGIGIAGITMEFEAPA